MFRKAERKKAKLRLGIVGPSGAGKTYTSLLVAMGIGGKVAVIDTENGSADLYAHLCDYDVATLSPPYTIQKYLTALTAAEKAGYDIIILDSISHAWSGEGGLLDQQGKIADSGRGNSYTAWRKITPMHNQFIEKMLSCNMHLIATMRAKTEYVLEENEKGKQMPKKVGMAPVQREGMDYEFTTVFDIGTNHNAEASKDRTGLFDGMIFRPDKSTGELLKEWLESGIDVADKRREEAEINNLKKDLSNKMKALKMDQTAQVEFFEYVTEGKATSEMLTKFIDRFDEYYNHFQSFKNSDTADEPAS